MLRTLVFIQNVLLLPFLLSLDFKPLSCLLCASQFLLLIFFAWPLWAIQSGETRSASSSSSLCSQLPLTSAGRCQHKVMGAASTQPFTMSYQLHILTL